MIPKSAHNLFHFTYEKTAAEIADASRKKIAGLEAKIAERQTRISRLREEHQIDDAALAQLLIAARRQAQAERFSYTPSSVQAGGGRMEERSIGAGVVNNLLTESDYVESDKGNVARLKLIVANLRPLDRITVSGVRYKEDAFVLSYDELEFLGFVG